MCTDGSYALIHQENIQEETLLKGFSNSIFYLIKVVHVHESQKCNIDSMDKY